MYESFYGLSLTPFRLTPDPLFFFKGASHKRGLAFLRYAFLQREGFVVITGAPGTGKTELMLNLINELPSEDVLLAKVVTSNLGADDLLDFVAASFLSTPKASNKGVTLKKLEEFFIYQAKQGKQILLLIDEAHNLHTKSLIELSMLSNFQLGENPLLQCFLLGQEPLENKLELPELAHLKQRVIVSTHLEPLNQHDTRAYIEHRLSKAGWKRDPEFTKATHSLIFQYSTGIPRKINAVCNRILLEAYLDQKHIIDHRLAFKVIKEIQEELGVSPMSLDPDFSVIDSPDTRSSKPYKIRQFDRAAPKPSSPSKQYRNVQDRASSQSKSEPEPVKPARQTSVEQSYSSDSDDSVVVATLPVVSEKTDIKAPIKRMPSEIPNNVLRLNTSKNPKRKPDQYVASKKLASTVEPKVQNTPRQLVSQRQASNQTQGNNLQLLTKEAHQSGAINNELQILAPFYSDSSAQNIVTAKAQTNIQEEHDKKIIIEELAQNQGIETSTLDDENKAYERLSTSHSKASWSPISRLGMTISVISLFAFWWFIYGPGLDATLEAFNLIASTLQEKLNQYDLGFAGFK
ncbi:ExeA family protein [Kaarinaea lacus]